MTIGRSLGAATARFFEANLTHIKGPLIGDPFDLDEWQRDDLELILEVDDDGMPVWREVLWGVPRGSGKSPTVAGLALTELATRRDRPEVLVGSGAREQANIVGEFMREMASAGNLRHWTRPIIGGVRWDKPGGGVAKVISADGNLQHGRMPSKAILDELHVFTTTKQEELYNAQASSLHKRPDSQLISITTAGWSMQTLLGELYAKMLLAPSVERTGPLGCRLVCRDRAAGRLMIWWGAHSEHDAADPAVWAACNPASWIGEGQIEGLARRLPRPVFERLHLNRWTESSDAVIRPGAWDACLVPGAIADGASVVLGVSANPRRDAAAVVAAHRDAQSRIHVQVLGEWDGVDQGDLEVLVGDTVEDAARRFAVDRFAADPIQLTEANRRIVGLGVREYRGRSASKPGMPQTDAYMEPASGLFGSLVEARVIAHGGDKVLRRAVLGCEARDTRRGWRLARPKMAGERRPESVEPALAAAMAVYALDATSSVAAGWGDTWD
jgi:phage terminase large subunit-like protein